MSLPRSSIRRYEGLSAKNGLGRGFGFVNKTFGNGCGEEKLEEAQRGGRRGGVRAVALPATPLIAAGNTWGTWTVLLAAGAFGIW